MRQSAAGLTSPSRTLAFPVAAALAAMLLGLVLRIEGARGELWIDEVWTLDLLKGVSSLGGVVWGINHDNNHILNSMWLYLLGPEASTLSQRGLSILFGTLSVGAAFAIGLRRGRAEALAAGLLFAVAYPMVYFGSEARGYAGFILFTLLAIRILEKEFATPSRRNRLLLAASLGLAVLSQFIALAVVALLGVWTAWHAWRETDSLREAERRALATFLPTLALILLIGAAVLLGAVRDGFEVGNVAAAGFLGGLGGYGELVSRLLGGPARFSPMLGFVPLAAALALATFWWRRGGNERFPLYFAGLVGLPLLMLIAQLPNLELPRYFLASGILFLFLLADLFGAAWRRGGAFRAAAALAFMVILAGNAVSLANFYEHRRSHYGDALALMAENTGAGEPIVYAADHDFRTSTMIGFLAPARGLATLHVRDTEWCATPPAWLLYDPGRLSPGRDAFGYEGEGCALRFERLASWPAWGLSGPDLAVARRVP